MISNELEGSCELKDRSCDALVLAYSPKEILSHNFGKGFYIPGNFRIEEAYSVALRTIFSSKQGSCSWCEGIAGDTINILNNLEKRIREGTFQAIQAVQGNSEHQTLFNSYLSDGGLRFEHTWIPMKGDFYRFTDGKREEALDLFDKFWDEKEKSRWKDIHECMRAYTKKEFEEKKTG